MALVPYPVDDSRTPFKQEPVSGRIIPGHLSFPVGPIEGVREAFGRSGSGIEAETVAIAFVGEPRGDLVFLDGMPRDAARDLPVIVKAVRWSTQIRRIEQAIRRRVPVVPRIIIGGDRSSPSREEPQLVLFDRPAEPAAHVIASPDEGHRGKTLGAQRGI